MRRLIGIDFGLKRIGLSISDPGNTFALALKTVQCFPKDLKKTVDSLLQELAKEDLSLEKISQFVVGYPIHLSGNKSDMCKHIDEFAKILQDKTEISVHLADERLTSKAAESLLSPLSLNRKKRSQCVDVVSATIILQSFIDKGCCNQFSFLNTNV